MSGKVSDNIKLNIKLYKYNSFSLDFRKFERLTKKKKLLCACRRPFWSITIFIIRRQIICSNTFGLVYQSRPERDVHASLSFIKSRRIEYYKCIQQTRFGCFEGTPSICPYKLLETNKYKLPNICPY